MLTSVRSLLAATVLAGAALAATPAMAQDEEDTAPVTITGNVTLVTDYRFRGIGLSGGDLAIQGGLTANTEVGLYAGVWASSLEDSSAYGEIELDAFVGYAGSITDSVGFDVGALYYLYPSNAAGYDADVLEFYAKVKPTIGPVGLTLGVAYAPEQDSLGGTDNLYLSADAAIGIPSTPLTINGHLGYTDGDFMTYTGDGSAFDWSVGASLTVLGGLSVGVSYVGVESSDPRIEGFDDDTVVGSIGFAF